MHRLIRVMLARFSYEALEIQLWIPCASGMRLVMELITTITLRVMAPRFREHHYRRQRTTESMGAAVGFIQNHAAALQAVQASSAQVPVACRAWQYMSSQTDVVVQSEVAQRLVLIAPVIRAQVQAAVEHGRAHHAALS